MSTEYERRVTAVVLVPPGLELFDEMATEIKVESMGDGEYLVLTQTWCDGLKGIAITGDEWPALRSAIDDMVKGLRA
jgi:hypothetical protein